MKLPGITKWQNSTIGVSITAEQAQDLKSLGIDYIPMIKNMIDGDVKSELMKLLIDKAYNHEILEEVDLKTLIKSLDERYSIMCGPSLARHIQESDKFLAITTKDELDNSSVYEIGKLDKSSVYINSSIRWEDRSLYLIVDDMIEWIELDDINIVDEDKFVPKIVKNIVYKINSTENVVYTLKY